MKKPILYFSSLLFLFLGVQQSSFAQGVNEGGTLCVLDDTHILRNENLAMTLSLPESNNTTNREERKNLVSGLRLMELTPLSGEIPIDFNDMIQGKTKSLSQKVDYGFSLPYSKVRIELSIDSYGKVTSAMVDGNKLDEHFIKELEDALLEWQFLNSTLEGEINLWFELMLV